jgi:hypothetical protein
MARVGHRRTTKKVKAKSETDQVHDLYKANKKTIGKNPNLIHPGEKIKRSDGSSYTVKKGDNLYKIARGTPKAKAKPDGLMVRPPHGKAVDPHTDLMGRPQPMPGSTGRKHGSVGTRVSPPTGSFGDPHTDLMGKPQTKPGARGRPNRGTTATPPTPRGRPVVTRTTTSGAVRPPSRTTITGNVPGPLPPQKIGPSSPNGDTGPMTKPPVSRVGAPGSSPTPSIKTPGKAKTPNASARARQVASPRAAFKRA